MARKTFTAEYRKEALRMVREGKRVVASVARELGINQQTLSRWLKQAEIDEGRDPESALTTSEREELQRLRGRIAHDTVRILHAPSLADAKKRKAEFDAGLGAQVPECKAILDAGFEAATRYYAFPKEHWRRIRSTNGLERLHGEIKRRIKSIGAFPDRSSALRLITAVALQITAIWSDRRHLDFTQHVEASASPNRPAA